MTLLLSQLGDYGVFESCFILSRRNYMATELD